MKCVLINFVLFIFLNFTFFWLNQTDPENTDYVCEKGATRNFQAQLMMERQEENVKKEKEEEELNNPMKVNFVC